MVLQIIADVGSIVHVVLYRIIVRFMKLVGYLNYIMEKITK